MKIKLFLFTILSFLTLGLVSVRAQTKIDTLTWQLKNTTNVTAKLNLYKKIYWHYISYTQALGDSEITKGLFHLGVCNQLS